MGRERRSLCLALMNDGLGSAHGTGSMIGAGCLSRVPVMPSTLRYAGPGEIACPAGGDLRLRLRLAFQWTNFVHCPGEVAPVDGNS